MEKDKYYWYLLEKNEKIIYVGKGINEEANIKHIEKKADHGTAFYVENEKQALARETIAYDILIENSVQLLNEISPQREGLEMLIEDQKIKTEVIENINEFISKFNISI